MIEATPAGSLHKHRLYGSAANLAARCHFGGTASGPEEPGIPFAFTSRCDGTHQAGKRGLDVRWRAKITASGALDGRGGWARRREPCRPGYWSEVLERSAAMRTPKNNVPALCSDIDPGNAKQLCRGTKAGVVKEKPMLSARSRLHHQRLRQIRAMMRNPIVRFVMPRSVEIEDRQTTYATGRHAD